MMKKKKRLSVGFLLPSLLGVMAFFIIPFFMVFKYAFTKNSISGEFVGLKNFSELLHNEYFRLALYNTIRFILTAVPLVLSLTTILALLCARYIPKLPFVKSAFFLPYFLPSATIISLWTAYMQSVPAFESLLLIYIWKYGGLNFILLLTALCGLPVEMTEAAKIDGASGIQRALRITLPNIMPTLFFVIILSINNAFRIFRESYLLYGQYPEKNVYMLQNYLNNHFEKLNYQNISTAAIFFAVIVYILMTCVFVIEKRWSDKIW